MFLLRNNYNCNLPDEMFLIVKTFFFLHLSLLSLAYLELFGNHLEVSHFKVTFLWLCLLNYFLHLAKKLIKSYSWAWFLENGLLSTTCPRSILVCYSWQRSGFSRKLRLSINPVLFRSKMSILVVLGLRGPNLLRHYFALKIPYVLLK